MLSYQINLDTQSLVIKDQTGTILQEKGFHTFLAQIFLSIVGQRLAGYMLIDHLEVYQIKREQYIRAFLAM